MPFGDRTGPVGEGPMTGRGLGPCGRGQQRGAGFGGFARRGRFAAHRGRGQFDSSQEVATQTQIQDLTAQIQILTEKIEELQDKG